MKIMKEKIMKYMFYYIIISRQNQRKLPPARFIPALHRIPVFGRKSAKKKAVQGNKEYNKGEEKQKINPTKRGPSWWIRPVR